MDIKHNIVFGVMMSLLASGVAAASGAGLGTSFQGFHPVITLQGGLAAIHANRHSQNFVGTDDDVFTYNNANHSKNTGFGGIFLGIEQPLPWMPCPQYFMQTGMEYNYFGKTNVKGNHAVGIEPQTSTSYQYSYHLQTQQLLGTLKFFTIAYERFHMYGEAGLGAAFNNARDYNAETTDTGSLNLTPVFGSHNETQFSYSVGLGIETQVNSNIRVGCGYRYSHFGKSSLGKGKVIINNYQSPVSFAPGASAYTNQFVINVSYVAL